MIKLENIEGYIDIDSLNGCEGCAFNDVNLIDECLAVGQENALMGEM